MEVATSKYRLLRANSLDWLTSRKTRTIHSVVTDPPFVLREYSKTELEKKRNGHGGLWRIPINYDGCERQPTPRFTGLTTNDLVAIREFHEELASSLFRVLVPGGHIIMASNNLVSHIVVQSLVDAGFELRGQIAREVKTLRGGDRPKGAHHKFVEVSSSPRVSWEPWIIARKPCEGTVRENLERWGTGALRRPAKNTPFRDLIESHPAKKIERVIAPHPSLKPQSFMRQIVRASLPLARGVVLDPFMGSGATIAAALALNLRAIGIEVNSTYYTMAKRAILRLSELEV